MRVEVTSPWNNDLSEAASDAFPLQVGLIFKSSRYVFMRVLEDQRAVSKICPAF